MDQALITVAVEQAVKNIKSQEYLFALAVLALSMGMLYIGGQIFISMTNKRDETIKGLSDEVRLLNTTNHRMIELQNADIAGTAKNRDLLQQAAEHLTRLDQCLTVLKSDISNHAIECRQKVLKP